MNDVPSSSSKKPAKILLSPPMNRTFQQKVTVPALNDGGLGYIAAACKKTGADVSFLSWNTNLDMETFRNKLLEIRPDVAFVLYSRGPDNIDIGSIETKRAKNSIVVGFNISGLLLNGG